MYILSYLFYIITINFIFILLKTSINKNYLILIIDKFNKVLIFIIKEIR